MDARNEVNGRHTTSMFQILGVREDATPSQIRKAYLERLKDVHPDKNPPSMKDLKTKELLQLQDAYNWLNARHQCHVNRKGELNGDKKATNSNVSGSTMPTIFANGNTNKTLSSQINLVAFGLVVGPRRKS